MGDLKTDAPCQEVARPSMVVRKHPRFAVQLPVSFSTEEVDADGTVYNLSLGGCRVESDHPMQGGEYVALRLRVSYDESPISVQVAVVRWSAGGDFGLEFLVIAEEERAIRNAVIGVLVEHLPQSEGRRAALEARARELAHVFAQVCRGQSADSAADNNLEPPAYGPDSGPFPMEES